MEDLSHLAEGNSSCGVSEEETTPALCFDRIHSYSAENILYSENIHFNIVKVFEFGAANHTRLFFHLHLFCRMSSSAKRRRSSRSTSMCVTTTAPSSGTWCNTTRR